MKLARMKTSTLIGFTVVLGIFLQAKTLIEVEKLILFGWATGFFLMAAMNTFNDIFDIESDKIIKPERVIPRGIVRKNEALVVAILETVIGLLAAAFLGFISFVIVLILILLGVFYSLQLKAVPFVKNLLVGWSLATGILIGALSVNTHLQFKIWGLVFASGIAFTAFELHKDIGDREGDLAAGKITLPIKIGPQKSSILSYASYILSLTTVVGMFVIIQKTVLATAIFIASTVTLYIIRSILFDFSKQNIEKTRKIVMGCFSLILLFLILDQLLYFFCANNNLF